MTYIPAHSSTTRQNIFKSHKVCYDLARKNLKRFIKKESNSYKVLDFASGFAPIYLYLKCEFQNISGTFVDYAKQDEQLPERINEYYNIIIEEYAKSREDLDSVKKNELVVALRNSDIDYSIIQKSVDDYLDSINNQTEKFDLIIINAAIHETWQQIEGYNVNQSQYNYLLQLFSKLEPLLSTNGVIYIGDYYYYKEADLKDSKKNVVSNEKFEQHKKTLHSAGNHCDERFRFIHPSWYKQVFDENEWKIIDDYEFLIEDIGIEKYYFSYVITKNEKTNLNFLYKCISDFKIEFNQGNIRGPKYIKLLHQFLFTDPENNDFRLNFGMSGILQKISRLVNSYANFDNPKSLWLNYFSHLTHEYLFEIDDSNNLVKVGRFYSPNESSYYFKEKTNISIKLKKGELEDATVYYYDRFFDENLAPTENDQIKSLHKIFMDCPDISRIHTEANSNNEVSWRVIQFDDDSDTFESNEDATSNKLISRIFKPISSNNLNRVFNNYNTYLKKIFEFDVEYPEYLEKYKNEERPTFNYKAETFSYYNLSIPHSDDYSGSLMIISNKGSIFDLEENFQKWLDEIKRLFNAINRVENDYLQRRKVYLINQANTRSAIISIIVDSYAHNISAHSLAALKWWMQIRSENVFNKEIDLDHDLFPIKKSIDIQDLQNAYNAAKEYLAEFDIEKSTNKTSLKDLIQFTKAHEIDGLFKFHSDETDYYKFPIPIDFATYQFFKFLRDKASFWSGVTRDMPFGGESKNFYETLWYDLLKNTLYLGTIAHSEGINKVTFHVHLPQENVIKEKIENGQNNESSAHNSEFAIIDLSILKYDSELDVNKTEVNNLSYKFLKPGKDFRLIKSFLSDSKYDVFFPGGIVGQHAFYTIIENTLRNIKHYKISENEINNGIEIHLSIEPDWLCGNDFANGEEQLFKIKLWLNHKPNVLDFDERMRKIEQLSSKQVLNEETNSPRLGGNSQDKICAAMLLNGTFISVDRRFRDKKHLQRDAFYYNDIQKKYWLSFLKEDNQLKKVFHLWKAKYSQNIEQINDYANENLDRFKFLINNNSAKLLNNNYGHSLRIVEDTDNPEIEWLHKWLKTDKLFINIKKKGDESNEVFFNLSEIGHRAVSNEEYDGYDEIVINLKHRDESEGGSDCFDVRNHGFFLERIFKKSLDELHESNLQDKDLIFKLIETIGTKIICIDNRIYKRYQTFLTKEKIELIQSQLFLKIIPEDSALFKRNLEFIKEMNFLIIHLTFLENIANGFDDHIGYLLGKILFPNDPVPDNFKLVVTTGRGRIDFWNNIKNEEHKGYVIFKPIESLLSAVEDALILKDDIQIKYNLVQVLFGS